MKYRWSAFATVPYGSGRASMRALYCLYCFFCSSEPVSGLDPLCGHDHFSPSVELFDTFSEEAPGPPELVRGIPVPAALREYTLRGGPFSGRDLLHVDEAALLDPDEQGVNGAFGDVGEALLPQPRRDLVAVRGLARTGSRGRCPPACP